MCTEDNNAFDLVIHHILLLKLSPIGVNEDLLRWLSSYITNRNQAVVVDGFKSKWVTVPLGYPEGPYWDDYFLNIDIYFFFR